MANKTTNLSDLSNWISVEDYGKTTFKGYGSSAQITLERVGNSEGFGHIGADSTRAFRAFSHDFLPLMDIHQEGYVIKQYHPYFNARNLPQPWYPLTHGSVLTFLNTDNNQGGHWNGTRFTAPITGKYLFSCNVMYKNVDGDWHVLLYKNGTVIVRTNPHAKDQTWHSHAISQVVACSAGDYIEFGVSGGASDYAYATGEYTTCSGILLS